MNRLTLGMLCGVLLASPTWAVEPAQVDIDAVTANPSIFKLLLENEHVRVLEYTLAPGERDQWHTHPPKVSYVLSGGTLEVFLEDGTSFKADEVTGTASWAGYRGKHYVRNIGTTPVRILLVEDKSATKQP